MKTFLYLKKCLKVSFFAGALSFLPFFLGLIIFAAAIGWNNGAVEGNASSGKGFLLADGIVRYGRNGNEPYIRVGNVCFPFSAPKNITSPFGYRVLSDGNDKPHEGVDYGAAMGTPIFAVMEGDITKKPDNGTGFGNHISSKTTAGGTNIEVIYAHLSAFRDDISGHVLPGEIIGYVGNTGYSFGAHLHLQIEIGGVAKNPIELYPFLDAKNRSNYPETLPENYGSGNEEIFFNYFRSLGYSPEAVCGIMGNIQIESGFKPEVLEQGGGTGIGLCQWSFGRADQLKSYADSLGESWEDLLVQAGFLEKELSSGAHIRDISGFKNIRSVEEATEIFCLEFERPADYGRVLEKRKRWAYSFYNLFCG